MAIFGAPKRDIDPAPNAAPVTPSNTAVLTGTQGNDIQTQNVLPRWLRVGGAGNMYVDLVGNGAAGASATGTLSVSGATGTVGATINGVAVTATAPDTDDAATATLLAAAFNANGTTSTKVSAAAGGAGGKVVTLTALHAGPASDYTLVASGTGVTASGATMTGGTLATGTVNFTGGSVGQVGAVVNGTTVTVAWTTDANTTAGLFVTALEADPTVGGAFSSSVNNAGVVTITITNPVSASVANAYTLAASGTGITVGAATFAGAVNATGTLTLSGVTGTVGGTLDGTLVTVTAASNDDAAAAVLIAAAITSSVATTFTTATAASTTVTITASVAGLMGNAITLTASGTGITASGATLSGGTGGSGNYVKYICVAGQKLDIRPTKVYALGTTATNIVAEW